MTDVHDITQLLKLWNAGESQARDNLFARMYVQLKGSVIAALKAERHGLASRQRLAQAMQWRAQCH